MWAHLICSNSKKKEKRGPNDDISPSKCFRGTPGLVKKSKKDKRTNNKHKGKKREERGQKRQNKSRAPSSESEAKRR